MTLRFHSSSAVTGFVRVTVRRVQETDRVCQGPSHRLGLCRSGAHGLSSNPAENRIESRVRPQGRAVTRACGRGQGFTVTVAQRGLDDGHVLQSARLAHCAADLVPPVISGGRNVGSVACCAWECFLQDTAVLLPRELGSPWSSRSALSLDQQTEKGSGGCKFRVALGNGVLSGQTQRVWGRARVAKGARILSPTGRSQNHGGNVCSTWGDFHYKTFDGDIYRFPGLCDYNLASDCRDSYKEFSVHLKRVPGEGGGLPQIESVLLTLGDDTVYLTRQLAVMNGAMVSTPHYGPGLLIDKNDAYTKVYSRAGLTLMWDQEDSLMLELDSKFQNHTCGLCGDYNGLQTYSEFLADGVLISALEFGNMQKVNEPEEQCEEPEEASTPESCSEHRAECETLLTAEAFEACQDLVPREPYVSACVQDRCQCPANDTCVCSTVAQFSRQCSHAGGRPGNWRTPTLCPKSCPGNMVYLESGSPCMDSCSHLEVSSLCEEHYMDGCFCPEGTVYDDIAGGGCIPASQCHCRLHGHQYAPGQEITNDCEQCVCDAGRWVCQDLPCPGTCALEGGAHITTFDGKKYTFHGDCYYVLAKDDLNGSYALLGELASCGSSDTQTCLKTVLLLADDEKNVVAFRSDGSVMLNELQMRLPHVTPSFSVLRPSSYHVVMSTAFGLRLQVQLAPIMQLFVTLDQAAQGQVQGLCGNFNGLESDDFLTAGGLVEATGAGFANTWKAQSSCQDKEDWLDDPCSLSVESANYAEHWCSLLKKTETPFGRCHSAVDPAEYYKRCKYDTCNCENNEDCLCAALSSYAHACAAKGITLWGWREQVCNEDVDSCPNSQLFLYNLTTCQQTCRSLSEPDAHCLQGFVPVDGCGCPDHTFLDEKGRCVPLAKCSCYHRGLYLEAGDVVVRQEERCVCRNGRLHCAQVKLLGQSCAAPKIQIDCNNLTALATAKPRPISCQTLAAGYYHTECISGCVCPDGLMDDGRGGCVVEEECPCVHNRDVYSPGDKIKVDCNSCTCQKGRWVCTQAMCHGTCSIYGSGHYVTFDGKHYDFDGHCSYVAVQDYCGQNSSLGSFSIITENVPCGTTGVTCSKAIKIFLGRTELKLEDKHHVVIQRDVGHHVPYTTREVGQYLVVEASIGVIVIWDKKTTVFVKLDPSYKGAVCGLCGNFDHRSSNDLTTRDHMVVSSELDFGNSWKEASTCPDVSTVPEPCSLNPHRHSWAEKQCSILKSSVFSACHSKVDPKAFYEACVHDSCSCDTGGDCECFCSAVAAYAQECTKEGACVFWRTPDLCPVFCDYYNPPDKCEWHYEPCGNRSFETCRTLNGIHSNISVSYLEGCYPRCPKDRPIYDEDLKKCVSGNKCGCYVEDTRYLPGASVPTEEICKSCVCTDSSHIVCRPEEGKILNLTQDGVFCYWETCGPNGTVEKHFDICESTTTRPSTPTVSTTPTPGSRPSFTTTTGSPTPSTGTVTNASFAPPELCCFWSDWINDHHPGSSSDSGDRETFEGVCRAPEDIECRSATEPHLSWEELGQKVQCDVSLGFICHNEDQFGNGPFELCYDYEIRVNCCLLMDDCPLSTPATTTARNTPTAIPSTTAIPIPPTATPIPPTATPIPPTATTPIPPTATPIPPTTTTPIPPTTTPIPSTITTSIPPTTTPIPSTTTPFPPSSTTHTTSPSSTTVPTTIERTTSVTTTTTTSTATPTPEPTTPSTPVPTTTPCVLDCEWTGWLDSGKPDYSQSGGEVELIGDVCGQGRATNISCRAAMYPETPIEELGQTVVCDVSMGLECKNQDQKPGGMIPMAYCINYEINVYCCKCGSTPAYTTTTATTLPITSTQTPGATTTETPSTTPSTTTTGIPLPTPGTTTLGTPTTTPGTTTPGRPTLTPGTTTTGTPNPTYYHDRDPTSNTWYHQHRDTNPNTWYHHHRDPTPNTCLHHDRDTNPNTWYHHHREPTANTWYHHHRDPTPNTWYHNHRDTIHNTWYHHHKDTNPNTWYHHRRDTNPNNCVPSHNTGYHHPREPTPNTWNHHHRDPIHNTGYQDHRDPTPNTWYHQHREHTPNTCLHHNRDTNPNTWYDHHRDPTANTWYHHHRDTNPNTWYHHCRDTNPNNWYHNHRDPTPNTWYHHHRDPIQNTWYHHHRDPTPNTWYHHHSDGIHNTWYHHHRDSIPNNWYHQHRDTNPNTWYHHHRDPTPNTCTGTPTFPGTAPTAGSTTPKSQPESSTPPTSQSTSSLSTVSTTLLSTSSPALETSSTPLPSTPTAPTVTTTGSRTPSPPPGSQVPTPSTTATPPGTTTRGTATGLPPPASVSTTPVGIPTRPALPSTTTSSTSSSMAPTPTLTPIPIPSISMSTGPEVRPSTGIGCCKLNDTFYAPGELVYNGTHGDTCYYVNCSLICTLEFYNWSCPSTPSPTPAPSKPTPAPSKPTPTAVPSKPTSSPTPSTPATTKRTGCPDFDPPRQENETWRLCECLMATCKHDNTVEIVEMECKPPPMPTCSNGLKPVAVPDPDGCCWHWECDCYCTGWGDPHYVTFDGLYYSYQGNCTYVLVEEVTPTVDNFGVYIDNYHCDVNDKVSCPRTLIVRHETQEVLIKTVQLTPMEVEVQVNRQVVALPYKKYGLQVYESGINYVVDIPELGALVSYNGLSFSIQLPFRLFGNNTKGQCGTCTNSTADDCILPSGEVVSSCEIAADQWIVNDPSKPHCPHGSSTTKLPATTLPGTSTLALPEHCTESPLCQLIKDSVFAPCHALVPPQHYYDACVFDGCFVPDVGMECASLQTYAALCAQQGACIDWRDHTHGACSVECPSHREYRACGPTEEPTCESSLSAQNSTSLVEGCFCPQGTTSYAPGFDVCVETCGTGLPRAFGEHFQFDCKDCVCLEGGSGIRCQPRECSQKAPTSCEEDGTALVTEVNPADTCCSITFCKCNSSLCQEKPPSCPLGFEVRSKTVPGRCCPVYSCEPKGVCVHENAEYQPGSPVYSSKCQSCVCTEAVDNSTFLNAIACTHTPCNTSCGPGFDLVEDPGQCCKKCEQTHCIIDLPRTQLVLKPGDMQSDPSNNCTFFSCVKIHNQLVSSVSNITCPSFDPSTCVPGSITLMPNGCCRTCTPRNETRPICSTVLVTRELSHAGCTQLVAMNDCSGSCGTSVMYSAEAQSLDHRCSCCKEERTSQREVVLSCPDGSSLKHTYTHIESCLCQDTVCGLL
ncbi:PREDICTED: mucin-2 [Propithecus coquereli]|uniref:mucin-2 n=1 Tax=Propithecus coquereli TaxID=379532 RepID=UPI00063F41DF|nr:PREDICTED: mucin-2 [Propithecus coquereli]